MPFKIKKSLLSPIEQIMISALGFSLNLILIFYSDKETYGIFSLLNSYIILIVGVHNAIVVTPMLVELSNESLNEKNIFITSIVKLLLLFETIGLFFLFLYIIIFDKNSISIAAFFFALITSILREFSRSIYLLYDELEKSMKVTFSYCLLIIFITMLISFYRGGASSEIIFFTIGFINVFLSLPHLLTVGNLSKTSNKAIKASVARIWLHARWALPGVFVIWIQNNAFLTIVSLRLGAESIAELSAAKLLIMPYVSLFSGYTRPLISKFSSLRAKNGKSEILFLLWSISKSQLIICFSLASILFFLDYIDLNTGSKYKHILLLGAAWYFFAGFNCGRTPYSIFLQVCKKFNVIFIFTIVSSIVSIMGVLVSTFFMSSLFVIFSLALAEAVLLIVFYQITKMQMRGNCEL